MRRIQYIRRGIGIAITGVALAMALLGCSTQKNTWASRSYHQTKVKYNILYNGNLAYEEGLKAIQTANEDDYSAVLNLYPVSNHKAAEAAASQMDKTIEKCRKCIKLHSIKAKPKADPKRRSDPKYRAWLQQEEFNAEMGNAWIRLGEAEFHKGDFLGAVGTFTYISRHYDYDPDMVARCQLWIARAYAEMGWLYEAEEMLGKVQADALSKKHARLYAAVNADVLLKTKQYHAALPFLKIAVPYEKRKVYRPRFEYVLGQLYEKEGNKKEAVEAFRKVIRLAPPVVMEFNAKLSIAQLKGKSALKQLDRMTHQTKYKDQLDQIYGAKGNIYLAARDTNKALEQYNLAIEKATQAGMQKAAVLVRAGDLYYDRRDYVHAQPCYREAITILTQENDQFARIQRRSEVLDELIVAYNTVQLQDSLQRLSRMSEEEQRAVVEKLIADLIRAEQEAAEKQALAEREAQNGGLQSVNTSNMLGGGGMKGEWYFYNAALLRNGKQDFVRQWGTRTLEDNWRRSSKTVSSLFAEDEEEDELLSDSTLLGDSLPTKKNRPETDTHKPEYYLQQIPRTEADLMLSDSLIRTALIDMVYIYQDKMEDQALADETFQELCRRFAPHPCLVDLYYMYYLQALQHDDDAAVERYRRAIIDNYPGTQQAIIVSQPDYFERLKRMAQEQDSLFEATYDAYAAGQFPVVKHNKQYAEETYPLSPLMPRFLFLNAVAVARTDGQDAFVGELRDMVRRYPENELSAMAKDMLAMMGQGMESQTGGATTNLSTLREQVAQQADTTQQTPVFTEERNVPSVVLLTLPIADEQMLNRLQYEVALFNFSQFLIRDFDLQKMPVFGEGSALRVIGFDSMDEAEWWIGLVRQNTNLMQQLQTMQTELIPVTEQNLPHFQATKKEP